MGRPSALSLPHVTTRCAPELVLGCLCALPTSYMQRLSSPAMECVHVCSPYASVEVKASVGPVAVTGTVLLTDRELLNIWV